MTEPRIGLECRAPGPRCKWVLRPATFEPADVAEGEELRARHEWKKHRYRNSSVRKLRPADVKVVARPLCCNPTCGIEMPPGTTTRELYCANCRAIFRTSPHRRPRGQLRCRGCSNVFTFPVRTAPGRYSPFCAGCKMKAAA